MKRERLVLVCERAMEEPKFSIILDAEIKLRKSKWTKPAYKATTGVLKKFIDTVSTASTGCVTT